MPYLPKILPNIEFANNMANENRAASKSIAATTAEAAMTMDNNQQARMHTAFEQMKDAAMQQAAFRVAIESVETDDESEEEEEEG